MILLTQFSGMKQKKKRHPGRAAAPRFHTSWWSELSDWWTQAWCTIYCSQSRWLFQLFISVIPYKALRVSLCCVHCPLKVTDAIKMDYSTLHWWKSLIAAKLKPCVYRFTILYSPHPRDLDKTGRKKSIDLLEITLFWAPPTTFTWF